MIETELKTTSWDMNSHLNTIWDSHCPWERFFSLHVIVLTWPQYKLWGKEQPTNHGTTDRKRAQHSLLSTAICAQIGPLASALPPVKCLPQKWCAFFHINCHFPWKHVSNRAQNQNFTTPTFLAQQETIKATWILSFQFRSFLGPNSNSTIKCPTQSVLLVLKHLKLIHQS